MILSWLHALHSYDSYTVHTYVRALCYSQTPRLRKFSQAFWVFLETARAFCRVLSARDIRLRIGPPVFCLAVLLP